MANARKSIRDAMDICKTIQRNGHDAYIIGPSLQESMLEAGQAGSLEMATDMGRDELARLFPEMTPEEEAGLLGRLGLEECVIRINLADDADAGHPESGVTKVTASMLHTLEEAGVPMPQVSTPTPATPQGDGFKNIACGELAFAGIAEETLKNDYLLAVRALRYAANYNLPIEPNTWVAIVRGARRVNDYVAAADILDEMRLVEAENLHQFVRLLFDSMILHGLVPELAALSRVQQPRKDGGEPESVLQHSLEVMRHYPEELPYDWFGTLACMFHDIGKLYTAEYACEDWSFHQHHRVGAKVTRKILQRLGFGPRDSDLVCHLVRHHMRFQHMLTDKGIRRFRALDEYPRLMEMARADIKASGDDYTNFNHNRKYLQRADVDEQMVEPLLNGRQIMSATGLKPGPGVGVIREALLEAQTTGEVDNLDGAMAFVREYARREHLA